MTEEFSRRRRMYFIVFRCTLSLYFMEGEAVADSRHRPRIRTHGIRRD